MEKLERPVLLVVVDTEEEFDWHQPFNSKATTTKHMETLHEWQNYFDQWGAKPCYVTDYPVTENDDAMSQLCEYHHAGKAELGAHCHPWVNPPIIDAVNAHNSYPCNLPYQSEKNKITTLTDALKRHLGESPKTYKAGRYGFGGNTGKIITELGYDIDLSPSPAFDLTADGGPNYQFTKPNHTHEVLSNGKPLTTFPLSADFVGWGGPIKPHADMLARKFERFRLPGILARTKFSDRIKLSPEGFTSNEHIMLANHLVQSGHNILSWTFHSPSFVAGYTPYVRNEKELIEFKKKFDVFFDYFTNKLNGVFMTPQQLKKELKL